MSQSITKNPWLFACAWYKVEDIHRGITTAKDLVIPTDVKSREFAEFLTEEYRLAMRKGAELAISEMMDERKLDDDLCEDDSLEGSDGKQYEIKTIDDLLRVPPNRLKDCLAELETSIQICHAMAALTSAGAPTAEVKVELPSWTWIDDGKRDQNLKYADLNVELKADTDAKATD